MKGRRKMGNEKKDPFKDFIVSLNSVDKVGNTQLIIPNQNANYVDTLITQYGLIRDEEAREALIEILDDMPEYEQRYFRTVDKQYLMILLWDLFAHSKGKEVMKLLWTAFLMGMSFGEMIEWEDIDDPPK